jgi:4-amino-4-deoxy-L-arabinose transferase-like glycosyltransferase
MRNTKLLIPLILLIHLLLLFFLRFSSWPEMILWPYFLLKGLLPYRDIAMAHNPLLIFDLTIFYKIFGASLFNLKLYTWILILLTDLLIYWIARRITRNKVIAVFSLMFYVFWQPYFQGNGVWFDLYLAPFILLLFYFLYKKEFFWSGILFGLAILVKQTAFWFVFPIGFTFWWSKALKAHSVKRFLLGLAIPITLFVFYLIGTRTFQDFYFWAIKFGIGYLPRAPGQVDFPKIKEALSLSVPYALTLLPIFLILKKKIKEKKLLILLLVWCFFGLFGVYPRWGYVHFQPSLPFLAIISGLCISYISISSKRLSSYWWVYFVLVILGTIHLQTRFYRLHWQKPDRFFEKETIQVAEWLKQNTEENDKIFILNSWDHLYALSNTLPAVSPWVPTLPWYMEYPGVQEEIVKDLENEKPRLVVFEPYKEKGLGSYKPEKIDEFLSRNYTLKEIVAGRFYILELKQIELFATGGNSK